MSGAPVQDAPAEEGAKPSGTWKVGAWDPRVVKVLTLLAFTLPAVAYVAMLAHYQGCKRHDRTTRRSRPSWR